MKKIRLKKIFYFFCVPSVVILPFAISAFQFKDKKESSINNKKQQFLKLAKNKQELEKLLNEKYNYEEIAQKAKKNLVYTKWVKEYPIEIKINFNKTIGSIFDLEMSYDLKLWLLQNYLDQFISWERHKKNYMCDPSPTLWAGPSGDYTCVPYQGLLPAKLRPNPKKSPDKDFLYLQNKNKSSEFEYFKGEANDCILKSGVDNTRESYHPFAQDTTYFSWSNQTILNRSLQGLGQETFNFFLGKENIKKIIFRVGTQFIYYKKEEIAQFLQGIIKHYKIASNFASYSFVLSGLFNIATYDWDHPLDSLEDTTEKIAIDTIATALGIALTPGTPILGATLANVIVCFFDCIPSGNGHSLISNINDHGLNDWDSQIKYNYPNVVQNAINWSNDYQEGIEWKITDSFFDYPQLYIHTQDKDNWRKLSVGKSFNWGNKIGVHYTNE